MNIYIGNLAYSVTEAELEEAFGQYGEVTSAKLILDKFSGQSKGFGFVEMADEQDARSAIEQINGSAIKGRNVKVNEARPREDKPRSGGGRRF
ncbi:RNA recognition motif domain-containing protein [Marinicella sp. W31]|uniref:RNA recognition motif domain-containing protein n=1 Tax=Marinicella sp. W31 TaxID=3023713 RepID=UPI0037568A4F